MLMSGELSKALRCWLYESGLTTKVRDYGSVLSNRRPTKTRCYHGLHYLPRQDYLKLGMVY